MQRWLPGRSASANAKAGRKAHVMDIFGPLHPAESLRLDDLDPLPTPIVKTSDVWEFGFDLTESHELKFETLDNIMDNHNLDITGLNLTSTSRGNKYRTYRLMRK